MSGYSLVLKAHSAMAWITSLAVSLAGTTEVGKNESGSYQEEAEALPDCPGLTSTSVVCHVEKADLLTIV